MQTEYDVIIIGAGAVGGAAARRLCGCGLRLLCLEAGPDVASGISKANTGIIHSPALIPPGTLKSALSLQGRTAFPKLSSDLGFRYEECGALLLARGPEQEKAFDHYIEAGRKAYEALEAPAAPESGGDRAGDYRILRGRALRDAEPMLSPEVTAALFLPDTGRIIPYEYTAALFESAVAAGLDLRLGCAVTSVEKSGGGWEVTAGGRVFRSRFVINAAGHGAAALGEQAGFGDCGISPVKGQYLILDREAGPKLGHILFQVPAPADKAKGKGILVTNTVYGNLMIGPDAESGTAADDVSTDLQTILSIIEGARLSVPGFDPARAIKTFAGVRPKPAGGDFIIAERGGFVHLCGIESPGLTSSPAIADEAVGLLQSAGLELPPDPAEPPKRAPLVTEVLSLDAAELKRRIGLPEGGERRIVCRCEQVPEERIRDAAARGIPLLCTDAVKRRTRAGQGRCQGGFCSQRVKALLASINGCNALVITERGGQPSPERLSTAELRRALKEIG